jgi:hypothetical protein
MGTPSFDEGLTGFNKATHWEFLDWSKFDAGEDGILGVTRFVGRHGALLFEVVDMF